MEKQAREQEDSVGRWLAKVAGQLPPLDLDVEAAVGRIHRLHKHIERRMNETLADHGLSYGEWGMLSYLNLLGPPYRSSPGELSEKEGLSSGAMTNRLDQLEKADLVRRLPDPNDRRALHVELTEKGRKLWHEAVDAQAAKEAALAAALDKRELAQLNRLLRKALVALEAS